MDDNAKKALNLLKTFTLRGLSNMTRVLKDDFVSHLQILDLMSSLLKFLLGAAAQQSTKADDFLVSTLMLEMRADYLREAVMSEKKLTFG